MSILQALYSGTIAAMEEELVRTASRFLSNVNCLELLLIVILCGDKYSSDTVRKKHKVCCLLHAICVTLLPCLLSQLV